MISVIVNGKTQELEGPVILLSFLEGRQVPTAFTAVALNGVVLHRQEYDKVTLQEGDSLEIVRMVGGGQCLEHRM